MKTLKNRNGQTYYIAAMLETTSDNVYLLNDYDNKTEEEIQAGASPVQYIVARGWNEKYNCWDSGNYFFDEEAAINVFREKINNILY